MSADILGTSRDQCVSMVQYSFTSTETIRLVRTDSPGRPPRLSHSSWTVTSLPPELWPPSLLNSDTTRLTAVLLYLCCFSWPSPRRAARGAGSMRAPCTLRALVYHILPSTTAVFSYAIGSRKLSANEQFFVGAQTVVSLLQTTQIKQGVSFIAANKVYTSTNKSTIVWIEMELFFLPGVDASHVYMRALALGCFCSHVSTRTFRRAPTTSVDSCAEIKSAPSVA